jgi:dTDP-4-dehydrorhamnose 3,5-epimerase
MEPLEVEGAWVANPQIHVDQRGSFHEWFSAAGFHAATGRRFELAQANCSISRRGVIRGIHFSDVPPGQAKYVGCVSGSIIDVVVDLRVSSPGYGRWAAVPLDDTTRRVVFISEGLGHAFIALSEQATVFYLCSAPYAPGREHNVHPLDPAIGIAWPTDIEHILSDRDAAAPSLAQARTAGLLPEFAACQRHAAELRER